MALTSHKDPIPVQTFGPAGEHRLKIQDEAKLAMILTSSFYQDPLVAVIRELLANAQDAHQDLLDRGETPPKPIQIHLDQGSHQLTIADYGTGVAPDRVTDLLLGLGGTDKDQSEDRLGGWGLGAKSPFSLANQWHFEDRWEGQVYTYIAYMRDGVLYHSDPMVAPTSQPNGLTYRIPVNLAPIQVDNSETWSPTRRIEEIAKYFAAYSRVPIHVSGRPAQNLLVYDATKPKFHVQINGYSLMVQFRESGPRLITQTKKDSKGKGATLILGTVPYPLEHESGDLIHGISLPDIDIHVPIGFVDVTPSRDHFQASDHTVANLQALGPEISKVLLKSLETIVTQYQSGSGSETRFRLSYELNKIKEDSHLFAAACTLFDRLPHNFFQNMPRHWSQWSRAQTRLKWEIRSEDLDLLPQDDRDSIHALRTRAFTPSTASGYDWSEDQTLSSNLISCQVDTETVFVWNDVGPGAVTGARLIPRNDPLLSNYTLIRDKYYNGRIRGFYLLLDRENVQKALKPKDIYLASTLLDLPASHFIPFSQFSLNAAPAPVPSQPTSATAKAPAPPPDDWRLVQVGGLNFDGTTWRDSLDSRRYARPHLALDRPFYLECSRNSVMDIKRCDIENKHPLSKDNILVLVHSLNEVGILNEIVVEQDNINRELRKGHQPGRLYFVQRSGLSWWRAYPGAQDASLKIKLAVERAKRLWMDVGNHKRACLASALDRDLRTLVTNLSHEDFLRFLSSFRDSQARAILRAGRRYSLFPETQVDKFNHHLQSYMRWLSKDSSTIKTRAEYVEYSEDQKWRLVSARFPDFWTSTFPWKTKELIIQEATNKLLRELSRNPNLEKR